MEKAGFLWTNVYVFIWWDILSVNRVWAIYADSDEFTGGLYENFILKKGIQVKSKKNWHKCMKKVEY